MGVYHIHIHDMHTSHDMTLQSITLQDEKGRKRPSHASYSLPRNIRNCTKSWLQWADCKRLLRVYLSDAKNSISRQDHVLILFPLVPSILPANSTEDSKPHLHPSCYLDNSRELKDHFFIFPLRPVFFFRDPSHASNLVRSLNVGGLTGQILEDHGTVFVDIKWLSMWPTTTTTRGRKC